MCSREQLATLLEEGALDAPRTRTARSKLGSRAEIKLTNQSMFGTYIISHPLFSYHDLPVPLILATENPHSLNHFKKSAHRHVFSCQSIVRICLVRIMRLSSSYLVVSAVVLALTSFAQATITIGTINFKGNSTNTISWSSSDVANDPESFSIELINESFHSQFAIANNVETTLNSITFEMPVVAPG